MTLQLIIDRTSLALAPLVIPGGPVGRIGHWIPLDGIQLPDFSMRTVYAPPSNQVAGQVLLGAVLDSAAFGATVMVHGATPAALGVLKATLQAAVSQFSYTVTLDQDGTSQTWQGDATWPAWGTLEWNLSSRNWARAGLSIPVNPTGA